MAQTPGFRVKVLAAGLHQLARKCEHVSGELTGAAKAPPISVSGWASSAKTARSAAERAGKDVAAVAAHFAARGAHYNAVGTAFTEQEERSAHRVHAIGP
jgi:hypothetical protein